MTYNFDKEKHKETIENYLANLRKRSCDGYFSHEPDTFDKVTADDYAYIYALLLPVLPELIESMHDNFDHVRETMQNCITPID